VQAVAGNESDLKKLVLQLARRVAALEANAYTVLMMPGTTGTSVNGLARLTVWKQAVLASPAGHGLGGAEGSVAVGALQGLVADASQTAVPAEIRPRLAVVILVLAHVAMLAPIEVAKLFHHFVVAELGGNRQGTTLVSYSVEGTVSIPTAEQAEAVLTALQTAVTAGVWDSVNNLRGCSFTLQDEVPVAVDVAVALQRVLCTVWCNYGGTRPSGKAPPGSLEQKLLGRGRGRGKGRGR